MTSEGPALIAEEPPIGDRHVGLPDAAITPDWKYFSAGPSETSTLEWMQL